MLLMINVDDISGELVPHAIDSLMKQGAKSVHVVPAITKKGRPEFIFFIDAPEDRTDDLARYVTSELGTLGVKVIKHDHIYVPYHMTSILVECPGAGLAEPLTVHAKCFDSKESSAPYVKAEFDDLRAALDVLIQADQLITFTTLKSLVELVALSGCQSTVGGVTARPESVE
ncbi:DUF111 family protein [Pseudodesulfovibrio sp. JC047]|uniref:nickel insertion protein n=1 Tax=Pseudodesulfovibrio sp. JC047 TaxID=2683199 RepID=UPI0013D15708|nr:nickel insertion protein [Pseudodesulfovibrio sp. JC047]NDV19454.1 DUF111 family protein [Pseudodesulfovibrio sp. JC047]